MRVLVTGAAGFLAGEFVQQLREDGREVITTDRTAGQVDLVGDLRDPGFTASLPDVSDVVHCAAVQYVTPGLPRFVRREFFSSNNIMGTKNLVDRYDGKVDYFLHVGTSMLYAQTHRPVYTTASPMRGQGVYSETKLAALGIVRAMHNPVGVMIPCIIGGRGREGLFRGFVQSIVKHGYAIQPGSGNYVTHMVHVEDAALLLKVMLVQRAKGLYNAADPEPKSINQWIDIIATELGLRQVRRIHVPYWAITSGAWLTAYRVLAKEQALMLGQNHILSLDESEGIGWRPKHTNESIVRDITHYVLDTLH